MCIRDSQWTDFYPNGDYPEALLNTSFDWNGIREAFVVATAVSYTHLDVYKRQAEAPAEEAAAAPAEEAPATEAAAE